MNYYTVSVYATSCVSSSTSRSGIIPFPDKRTAHGINRLSSFLSSGTFTCEKSGLYLISATIYSYTRGGYFYIYKNSSPILSTYIGTWYTDTYYTTATGVATVELNVGQTISIRAGSSMYVYAPYSCLTILKLK